MAGKRGEIRSTVASSFIAGASLAVLAACSRDKAQAAPTAEQIASNSAALVTYLDAEYEEQLQDTPEAMTLPGLNVAFFHFEDVWPRGVPAAAPKAPRCCGGARARGAQRM